MQEDSIVTKLTILFILDKAEIPLSEESLLNMCSSDNDWVPYMFAKQTLTQLIESAFISNISQSKFSPMLSITSDGRVCLSHFYKKIPKSLRDNITDYIKNNRVNYRKKQEFVSDYYKNTDGTFTVRLKIVDGLQTVLDIKLTVPDRATAITAFNKWNAKAPDVFRFLYENLIEE